MSIPAALPLHQLARCPDCGAALAITVAGYRPRPAALPAAEPCPPAAERHRLSHWRRVGWLPEGVEPATIAAAFRRRFRVEPRGDRQCRIYSGRELGMCLGELGLAPPPDPLAAIWQRALQALELPSTRMLLSQQTRLVALEPSTYARRGPGELVARVAVVDHWLPLVEARAELVANALGETLGCVVAVELMEVGR